MGKKREPEKPIPFFERLKLSCMLQEEAGKRLGVSRHTLFRLRREGTLKSITYEQKVWISIASIEAYEESLSYMLPEAWFPLRPPREEQPRRFPTY